MAKKPKKTELEDDLNIVMMMWDGGTFASMIRNGNAEIARVADFYWAEMSEHGPKDPLPKAAFFKELSKMPELNDEDRCRVALNTAIRFREGHRPVGTQNDILALEERLYRDADQPLKKACRAAVANGVYGTAIYGAQYSTNRILGLRRILSAWMVQK